MVDLVEGWQHREVCLLALRILLFTPYPGSVVWPKPLKILYIHLSSSKKWEKRLEEWVSAALKKLRPTSKCIHPHSNTWSYCTTNEHCFGRLESSQITLDTWFCWRHTRYKFGCEAPRDKKGTVLYCRKHLGGYLSCHKLLHKNRIERVFCRVCRFTRKQWVNYCQESETNCQRYRKGHTKIIDQNLDRGFN